MYPLYYSRRSNCVLFFLSNEKFVCAFLISSADSKTYTQLIEMSVNNFASKCRTAFHEIAEKK